MKIDFPACGYFDASTSSVTISSTTAYISETLLHYVSVVEPVETTVSISLFLWSFRCFDRLNDHKLNNRISVCRTFRWLSQSKPPSSLAFSYSRFDASTGSATTSSATKAIESIPHSCWACLKKHLSKKAICTLAHLNCMINSSNIRYYITPLRNFLIYGINSIL